MVTLYFARFGDGGIYATGPQTAANGVQTPSGPIAYVLAEDAEIMAQAIGGTVIDVPLQHVMAQHKEHNTSLYIRQAGGGMLYIPPNDDPESACAGLSRIDGEQREAAIAASQRMSRL